MTWQTMTDDEATALQRELFKKSIKRPDADDSEVDRLMEESKQVYLDPPGGQDNLSYGTKRIMAGMALTELTKAPVTEETENLTNFAPIDVPDAAWGVSYEGYARFDSDLKDKARKFYTHELAKTERGEYALARNIKDFLRTNEFSPWYQPLNVMSQGEAMEYAKAQGVDLKFDKPTSYQTVTEAINVAKRRQELQRMLAGTYQGGNPDWLNSLALMGTTLTGAVGPVELATTILLGWAIPVGAVSIAANGAQLASKLSNAKKVADISKTVTALKTMQKLAEGSQIAKGENFIMYSGEAVNEMLSAAPKASEIAKVGNFTSEGFITALRSAAESGDKAGVENIISTAMKKELSQMKYSDFLESTQALKYDNLNWWAKSGADVASFPFADRAFIEAKYIDSNNLGLGYYSDRDRMTESLLAAFAGPGVLGAFRFVGGRLGLLPHSLVNRVIDDNIRKIDIAEATGKLSKVEANKLRTAHGQIKEAFNAKVNKETKKPNPKLEQMAEEIQSTNMDDVTAVTYTHRTIDAMANGKRLRLSEIPGNMELHTSHIDARVLSSGMERGFVNVLEEGLERSESKVSGVYGIKVKAETGKIGDFTIYGLSKEDAEDNLNLVYAALTCRDEKAYARLQEKAAKLAQFSQDMTDLEHIDLQIREHNTRIKNAREKLAPDAKIEEESINFTDQRAIRRASLMFSYLNYILPDDILEKYSKAIEGLVADTDQAVLGKHLFPDGALPGDETYAALINSPEDFKAVTDAIQDAFEFTKKWSNRKSARFEQLDKDFGEYAGDLRTAAKDLSGLANLDEVIGTANAEQMARVAESLANFDVGPNTTKSLFMGYDKVDFKDFKDVRKAAQNKRMAVSKARMSVAKMINTDEGQETLKQLDKYSVRESTVGSLFTRTMDKLDAIHTLEDTGFEGLDEAIHAKIRSQEDFQSFLSKVDLNNLTNRDRRAVRSFLRESLISVFKDDARLSKVLNAREQQILVNNITKELSKASESNPALIGALMTPENLKSASGYGLRKNRAINESAKTFKEKVAPLADSAEEMQKAGDYAIAWTEFQGAVMDVLRGRLSDIELQETQNLRVAFKHLENMKTNPEVAAEVLTGSATQTHYFFEGSAQSVEAQTKSSGMYLNNVNQMLLDKKTTDGTTLYQYAHAPENRDAIFEAIARIRRGEPGVENDNAYQAAKIIVDTQSTVLNYYRQFGANYDLSGSTIHRGSLQYADAALTDDEFGRIIDTLNEVPNVTPEQIINNANRIGEPGQVLYGKHTANVNESGLVKDVAKKCKQINEDIAALTKIDDKSTSKANMYFLRDLDLDEMFDKSENLLIPMNEVRDALLEGDLYALAKDDLYNVHEIARTLRRIRTALLGSVPKKGMAEANKYSPGFYHNFVQGVYDLSATATGKKAAAIDLLDNQIVFKNTDAEVEAGKKFGYKNLTEYLGNTFEDMVRGQAVLENFGTNPGEMADMLIDTYNRMVTDKSQDNVFRNALLTRAIAKVGKDPLKIDQAMNKYIISEGARDSVRDNVAFGCGLQNQAPSVVARWVHLIKTFTSASQLIKAGFKSFADYGTMMSGLMMNGMVENAPEAIQKLSYVTLKMLQHPELRRMHYAVTLLTADEYMRLMNNDLIHEVENASRQTGILARAENASRTYGNFIMNTFGRMEAVTNSNKKVGAFAISNSVAEYLDTPFASWSTELKNQWVREGFEEADAEFMKREFVTNAADLIRQYSGAEAGDMADFKLLDVIGGFNKSDDVFKQELIRRGATDITDDEVRYFKDSFMRRMWTMIDRGSSEMVSLPTGRQLNWMHGGRARNSFGGVIMDILTQYKSFGATMLYNNYGKYFANQTIGETGVTIVDLFNPAVRLANHTRPAIYLGAGGVLCTLAAAMIPIETIAAATAGQIQKPWDENGLHADLLMSTMLGSLGTTGDILDAIISGIQGIGQRGGGFSIQAAPSISNVLRTLYRLGKPLTSKRINDEERPEAIAAALGQEALRYTGLSTAPFVALAVQYFMGSALNQMASGGPRNYRTKIKQREKRGYIIMPWEKYPEFGGSWE